MSCSIVPPSFPPTSADLSPLELASGVLFGQEPGARLNGRGSRRGAVGALEEALAGALRRRPCLIAFSGGRDSSALLAMAVRVARREGLPEPVPITGVWPHAPLTQETEWQEEVVRHLGCEDWLRVEFSDELDLVGEAARRVMSWIGRFYPYNLHMQVPLLEAARGGALVTGLGGDQAFIGAGRPLDVLARRTRPEARDALRIAGAVAPRAARRLRQRRHVRLAFPWLRPGANEALSRAVLEMYLDEPLPWGARLRWLWRARYMHLTVRQFAAVASRVGAEAHHPFMDAGFIAALAREGGAMGFRDRTEAMTTLFGAELPPRLMSRETKASFNEALWTPIAQRFVREEMDEEGAARALEAIGVAELVDPAALAAHWRRPDPLANSFGLLQACFLAASR